MEHRAGQNVRGTSPLSFVFFDQKFEMAGSLAIGIWIVLEGPWQSIKVAVRVS